MPSKAVVLGTNYYIGLSVIRCLGTAGVRVVAVNHSRVDSYGFASRLCSERLLAPYYRDDPQGLLGFLVDYAREQSEPPVLFPCADPYVEFVDANLEALRRHYLISQAEPGLNTRLLIKDNLYRLAAGHDVPVPETVGPDETGDLDRVEKSVGYPCLVKPTDSSRFMRRFRQKLFRVHNRQQLAEALERAGEAGLEVVVQRLIPGFDDHMYTYDAFLDQHSKVTHWATFQKLRQYPINFGASTYTTQRYVPELHEMGAKFLEGVGFKGFAEIEFKKDSESGQYYLIEVNVRTTNFNALLWKLGLNMPLLAYKELVGEPIGRDFVTRDTRLTFWAAYEDFWAVRDYLRTGQLTLGEVLRSLFRPKAYAVWDWRDPMPALAFLWHKLGRACQKLLGRERN